MSYAAYDGIVFMNTFTRRKIYNYRCAARHYSTIDQNKNILIVPASSLGRVVSAIEDTQTTIGNSHQKVDATERFVKSYHSDADFQNYLKQFCAQMGVPFKHKNIVFAGDDTCLHFSTKLWKVISSFPEVKIVAENLINEANQESFTSNIKELDIRFGGPGVNTSYIKSALGEEVFRKLIYRASAIVNKGKNLPILRRSTLIARRLDDTKPYAFIGDCLVQIVSPTNVRYENYPHELHDDNAYLALHENPEMPISEFSEKYSSHHDSYVHAFKGLASQFFPSPSLRENKKHIEKKTDTSNWRLSLQQFGDPLSSTLKLNLPTEVKSPPKIDATSPISLLDIDCYIKNSDALILTPPARNSTRTRMRWWAFSLYSILVALKTDPRDAEKIGIIYVDSQSYNLVKLYFDLVNNGWSNDFPILSNDNFSNLNSKATSGLHHVQTGLAHFIFATDINCSFPMKEAEKLTSEILVSHNEMGLSLPKRYSNSESQLQYPSKKLPAQADVSFICTSHSERAGVHKDCTLIGQFLANNGYSAVWPGNERNNMKSLYDELQHCPRLVGVITEHLADAATLDGTIPSCTHPLMVENIYRRTNLLIRLAKINLIFPVGIGGVLEISSRLLLDDIFPEMCSIPAIFYSPEHAKWSQTGKDYMAVVCGVLLGDTDYQNLKQNTPFRKVNNNTPYYLVHTIPQLIEYFEKLITLSKTDSPSWVSS